MANIDMRTREGRAMRAASEAAKQAASAGQVLNEVAAARTPEPMQSNDQDHRLEPRNEDEAPAPQPRNDVRDNAMADIEARDLRNKGITDPEAAPEAAGSEPAAPLEKVSAATGADPPLSPEPAVAAAAPEAPKTVRVKIDGVESDALADEVEEAGGIRSYQTMRANENRLAKTNEILAETRRLQAQLAAMARPQAPVPVTKTDSEFIQEKIDTIRFGTPEESAKAMQEVLTRNRPTFDQNQIVSQAVVAMQQQGAEQAFVNEFQDIVTNPLLLKLTIQLKNERLAVIRQQKQQLPDWPTFYRSIGNEIRGAIGRQSQPATPPAAAGNSSQPDKEARKASIVNLPTAAARAALPAEAKPETREDILNEMRKSRGIPTG